MKKRVCIISAILAVLGGCSGESDDFAFEIHADPSRTHAPGGIRFDLVRDDGNDVRVCRGDWDFGDGVTMGGTYEAAHTYTEPGNYTVTVDLKCDDKKSHATTNVQIFDTVDLAVGALDARPLDVSTDGNLSVALQVSNEAEGALQVPTNIDFFLVSTKSPDAYREPGTTRIYRYQLPSIGAAGTSEGTKKLELDIPMTRTISTGQYYVAAVINPDQIVGESSYENNAVVSNQSITVRNQTTDGADFEPVQFNVSPDKTSVLTAISAQFRFVNNGSTTAETFRYEIWIGAKDSATDFDSATKIHDATIEGAIAGEEKTIQDVLVSVTPSIQEAGLYYFWLVLDSADQIVERDESNNRIRSANPIQVTNETILDADISVQTVDFTPSTTSPGGTFTAKIGLLNQGAQRTGSFICTLFLSEDMSLDINSDHIVGTINVNDLLANASREVSGIVEVDAGVKPGNYWLYAFCDSSGIVSEADEANNIYRSEKQIVVAADADVDLLFGKRTLESDSAKNNGENLRIAADVCNNGTTAAGPFSVGVTRTNLCDGTASEFARFNLDGIDAGKCQTVHIDEPFTCDFWCPSYQFSFTADVNQVITERDKRNNTAQLAETVMIAGDDCVCAADPYETNNATVSARAVTSVDDDLTLCRGDVDVFRLSVNDGQSFTASISHDNARSPLKMELLRGADTVATAHGSDSLYIQQMRLKDTGESPAYIRISGLGDGDANRYHLRIATFDATDGIDLAIDNLAIEGGALSASDAKTVTSTIHNLGSQNAPEFTIGYYISQTSEIDDTAWRIAQQTVTGLNAGVETSQSVSLLLPADMAGGAYHLIARIDDDERVNDVRRENNIVRSDKWVFSRTCWDVLDPNDSFETARVISFTDNVYKHEHLTVCQDNPDFYAFDVESGSSLDISVTNTGLGDFDLFLYDANYNEIASARTTAVTETIHKDIILGNQRLYLEVRLLDNIYNTAETGYDMTIQTGSAPSWLNCSDTFEPNDFFSSAYDLQKAALSGEQSSICPVGDLDYYKIMLVEGQRLQIGVTTDSSILRAALYNPDEKFVGMLTNLTQQTIDYTAVEEGVYYLRIFTNAQDASGINYTLKWLADDGPDVAVSNLLVGTDSVYAGQNLTIQYEIYNYGNEDAHTNVETYIVASGNSVLLKKEEIDLGAGENRSDKYKVTIPSSVFGNAKIIVRTTTDNDINPENNQADANIEIKRACSNDIHEPNDNPLVATKLENSITGYICPGDEDWFVIDASADDIVKLEYNDSEVDFVLYLYDSVGNLVDISDSIGSETLTIPADGTYYIKVQGTSSDDTGEYVIGL